MSGIARTRCRPRRPTPTRSPTASACARLHPRTDPRRRRRDPVLALHGAGLYAPGLGYYSAGATQVRRGRRLRHRAGTRPVVRRLRRRQPWRRCCGNSGRGAAFVELGGGSGAFAEVALKKLLALDALPARYAILEPSADLRERQRERLRERLTPLLFDLVEWLDAPPQDAWNGVLFANEVIDALPTPRFTLRDGEVFEEHVALDGDGRFVRIDRPADALLARRGAPCRTPASTRRSPTAIAPNCCRSCRTGSRP